MAKEIYYLRHKVDQELYVYLEIGETWEASIIMEFRIPEIAPHFIKTGALYENRNILIAFKYIAISPLAEIMSDKKYEWKPITPEPQLEYVVKNFIESNKSTN